MFTLAQMVADGYSVGPPTVEVEAIDAQIAERYPCPKCGGLVKENYKRFACTACDFSITKIPGSRQLDVSEAETLITERAIGPLQGFRSRLGRPFAAILKLTEEHKLEFDFGQQDDDGNSEPVDFSGQESLKCSSRRPLFIFGDLPLWSIKFGIPFARPIWPYGFP